MSKSHWMTEQTGNFSNDGTDTFDPRKRYVGVRLQQGVPLLDRDWNELEDMRRYEEVMLRKRYIGNGSPDDGFRISALDSPANDFKIATGRCLVDGFEAVNEPDTADHILYLDQEGVDPLTIPSGDSRIDIVYLNVWIREVTSAEDPALENPDVNDIETCVRHKIEWRVMVDEGSQGHEAEDYHHNYDIAKIVWKNESDETLKKSIQDLRRTGLAVDLVQERFGDVISTILKSNLPSDPEVMLYPYEGVEITIERIAKYYELVESGAGVGIHNFVDHAGNIWLFSHDAAGVIMCMTYSAGRWGNPKEIVKGYYQDSFEDHAGNIWLFFHDAAGVIMCMTYSAGRWGNPEKIEEGRYLNSFEDHAGNIWLFWQVEDVIAFMTYSAGSWGSPDKLEEGRYLNSFEDHAGNIWLFWQEDGTIVCMTYSAGSWEKLEKIDAKYNSYRDSFEDPAGNIWLLWQEDGALLRMTYRSGGWGDPIKTVEGEYRDSLEDHAGNMWLFWSEKGDLWCRKIVDVNAKIMDELPSSIYRSTDTQLTTGTMPTYLNSFIDHAGNIWLLYTMKDSLYKNIWCKRYVDGDWLAEMRLNSGTTFKIYANSFEDHAGNIWVFWLDWTQELLSCWCKKCYTSI